MKRKVDFLFRYEHKVRELDSLMLLKLELERRGYTVAFVGNYEIGAPMKYAPRVLVVPALYSDSQIKGDFLKFGIIKKIANLQWEQLIGLKEEEDPQGYHNIVGLGQRIVTFCWGQRSHERFSNTGVNIDKLPIVGQINTDLLSENFRKLLMTRKQIAEKYKIDPNKRWYLFISSFAYCEMAEFQAKLAKEQLGEEDFDAFTEISYLSRSAILDWFESNLKKYPDTIVIYRPHPDETDKCLRLKEMSCKYPNFKLIHQESIKHWVNVCDKIYNWFSTGIIDAIVLGKPIRMLRPVHIKEELDYRIMISSKSIKSQQEFDEDYDIMSNIEVFDKQMIESYYHFSDIPVYKQICDILEEMIKTNHYDLIFSLKEKIKLYYRIFYHKLRHILMTFTLNYIPNIFYPYSFREFLKRREKFMYMLKDGYERNVAQDLEISLLAKLFRPIIYGE